MHTRRDRLIVDDLPAQPALKRRSADFELRLSRRESRDDRPRDDDACSRDIRLDDEPLFGSFGQGRWGCEWQRRAPTDRREVLRKKRTDRAGFEVTDERERAV